MPLIGIINENEFYSDHYLAEIFSGDIRGVLESWQSCENEAREAARNRGEGGAKYSGYRTPANQLAGAARDLLQRIQDSERQRQPDERLRVARALCRKLSTVFELPFEPRRITLDDGAELPLLGELRGV